jgi:sugar lactone lactonase YvrE
MVALGLIFGLVSCSSASIGAPAAAPAGPTAPPGTRATTLYVAAAQVPGSLASLPARGSGTVAPRTHIEGTRAQLAYNYFAWVDRPTGRLWTTNCLSLAGTHGPVVAFRLGANGNAAPAVSIGGAATGLSGCQTGVTVDRLGNVIVADITNTNRDPGGQVAIFEPGQRGNVAPNHRIAGAVANFHSPTGVAVDSGGNLYVADSCQGYPCAGDVQVFAAGSNGNVGSIRTIAGGATRLAGPEGVALDSAGHLYVANVTTNTITVYAAGASGNAAPIRTLRGSNTELDLPSGIAVDGLGYLYVGTGDSLESPGTHIPVLIFAPNADANAAPRATITLHGNGLAVPSGVALQ